MVLSISLVTKTQVVLCGWFLCVCIILRKCFSLKMRFCDRLKLRIHANTEYANILGVFCMFQKAELLTAFTLCCIAAIVRTE